MPGVLSCGHPPRVEDSNHLCSPFILQIRPQRSLPNHEEAQNMLYEIFLKARPLMFIRRWRLSLLGELSPRRVPSNLLGLNTGGGGFNARPKIQLRLRYAYDVSHFLPFDEVFDSMLHELCHNVYGPHDEKFYALWNEVRAEFGIERRDGVNGMRNWRLNSPDFPEDYNPNPYYNMGPEIGSSFLPPYYW
jgi:hypothetical protein